MASILRSGPQPFHVVYCGPDEATPLSRDALDGAALYGQPGGGDDLDAAWRAMRSFAPVLTEWVRNGGRYVDEYIAEPGAAVHTTGDALVTVTWRDKPATIYFQDGPGFTLKKGAKAQVLARYSNGGIAALVAESGQGRVGLCGPHPEAPPSWYTDSGFVVPSPMPYPLAHDLIATTIARQPLAG